MRISLLEKLKKRIYEIKSLFNMVLTVLLHYLLRFYTAFYPDFICLYHNYQLKNCQQWL